MGYLLDWRKSFIKMKKITFLLFWALLLSCTSASTGKRQILNYLKEHTNGTEYTIIDVSEPDSLYSPFEAINSLRISSSMQYADLMEQFSQAYDKPTRKERRASALAVAAKADSVYHAISQDCRDIAIVLTNPSCFPEKANRIGYKARYKVDGRLQEDVFYLERNGKGIGHTASSLKDSYLTLCNTNGKLFEIKAEAEEAAKYMQ